MNTKRKGLALLTAGIMALFIIQCGGKSSGGGHQNGNTWLDVARFIDYQLGDVADHTTNTCGGNAAAVIGDHCKNRLQGTMSAEMLPELLRLAFDIFQPVDVLKLGDKNILFRHGFHPQTADPCNEDLDADGTPDYKEPTTCASAAQITCTGEGNYDYTIEYVNCVYNDGVQNWTLDGIEHIVSTGTSENELLVIGSSDGFRETDNLANKSRNVAGEIVRYMKINTETGEPVIGSEGNHIDGIEIVKLDVLVDTDGNGTDDVGPYNLFMANDFEDGLVLLTGKGDAVYVWTSLDIPNNKLLLDFYDVNLPRNGNEVGVDPGCQVQVDLTTVDLVNRQIDYTSTSDCLGHATDFPF